MRTVFIVLKENIIYFPPVLSVIKTLLDLNYKVVHIGVYTDEIQRQQLEKRGVTFMPTVRYNGKANLIRKFYLQMKFKHQVKRYLTTLGVSNNDYVWMMQAETICLLHKLVLKYPTIVHPFEFVDTHINWKYRLLCPSYDMGTTFRRAKKIVCCEYNRAQITKGIFALDNLPYILPNKPYIVNDELDNVPIDIQKQIDDILPIFKDKKVLLYQGIFLDKERRLEEFCQAIGYLPDEYMLVAMGTGSVMYEQLKSKYESDRILFIPFIRPPFHLLITKHAFIGILSYFPRQYNIGTVINPLYCAPNKIFEYARFGIPMLSNDIPGLYYIYLEYKCGECVSYPMTPEGIKNVILKMANNYDMYSIGAKEYYTSVNLIDIVGNILEKQ